MRIHDAIVVGTGGTGGYLVEPLARLLAYHPKASGRLLVIDGDTYEDKNAQRQVFAKAQIGQNKATATAARLLADLPEALIEVKALPEYLSPIGAQGLFAEYRKRQKPENLPLEVQADPIPPVLLVVSSVDNHASRKGIIEGLTGTKGLNFLFLSPGNDLDRGQVLAFGRIGNKATGPHPFDLHPELAKPKDALPGGCVQQAPSTPQLIGANMAAAVLTLWYAQAWLDGKPIHESTVFDLRRFVAKGTGTAILLDGGPLEEPNANPE